MQKRMFASLLFFVAACATSGKNGLPNVASLPDVSAKRDIPFVGKSKVNRYVLDNGLSVLTLEDHSSPTVAFHTWFKVGSRNEKKGYTGLAHLFEHLMFKRTKNNADGVFDQTLERAGAEGTNAFTSSDYTAYVVEVPKQHLELIMRLESDRMVNLVVDDQAFKTEREVVQNERRMRMENSPDGLMYQELMKIAYTKHPYGWPVIGFEEDLARMSARDAEAFYKEFYDPSHAVVVAVGDIDPEEVFALAKRYYGGIPRNDKPRIPSEKEPEQTEPRRTTLKLNLQVEKVLMGFPVPENTHDVNPALDLIEAVLSHGRASRLDRALVDTGIATSVGCGTSPSIDPSLFVCSASLQDKRSAVVAERVILNELQRLRNELVSDSELRRAKNLVLFSLYGGLSTQGSKATMLGHMEVQFKGFEQGVRMLDRLQTVTAEEVRAAARTYLKPNARNVVIGVKK